MAHTDHLGELLEKLHTDESLQEQFKSNPEEALASFELTHHERDAVITRDLDDLVAIHAVWSIDELPEALRGEHEEPHYNAPDHMHYRIGRIKHFLGRDDSPEVSSEPEAAPSG